MTIISSRYELINKYFFYLIIFHLNIKQENKETSLKKCNIMYPKCATKTWKIKDKMNDK